MMLRREAGRFFFFFQAEDGIRDLTVTGVQTCALPIYERLSLGLPEVLLGIHPGFGGTVRTVRVAGVRAAMELMLSGKPVRAEKALRFGLIDRLVGEGELRSAARELLLTAPAPRRAPWPP